MTKVGVHAERGAGWNQASGRRLRHVERATEDEDADRLR